MEGTSNPMPGRLNFQDAQRSFSQLDAETIAALIGSAADIALVIEDGVIRDVALAAEDLHDAGLVSGWIGKKWSETVTPESQPKISALLERGGSDPSRPARQVNHAMAGMKDLPVAYRTVATPQANRLIALGRDMRRAAEMQQRLLRVQQELERDYALMRQAEARYRMVFDSVEEALLIVGSEDLVIDSANAAACSALDIDKNEASGTDLASLFETAGLRALERMIAQAAATGQAECRKITARNGLRFRISATAFRKGSEIQIICRLHEAQTGQETDTISTGPEFRLLEQLPDGFVIADADLRIVASNRAFSSMTHMAGRMEMTGARLSDYLGRSATDLNVLISAIRANQVASNFATVLRDRFGSEEDVEVSGVMSAEGTPALYALSIRNVGRRLSMQPPIREELPKSVEHLTSLVGRMPLKDIVRDSTALIERLCIEAALRLTNDNRASAAEILGLSRQGLYSKLNRFGFEERE